MTGTEVLTGRVQDRNGPWLADRLLELGVDLAHIAICGDRPEDMAAQLRFMAETGMDLVITSGGLGPTADDLTMRVVAEFAGRDMVHDPALDARIEDILRPMMARWQGIDPEAVRAGTRKQATVPAGVTVLEPAGTAPGAVVALGRRATARPSSSCPARRASCTACGPTPSRPRSSSRPYATAAATSSTCCGCSASRSRRSPRRCGWPRRIWVLLTSRSWR